MKNLEKIFKAFGNTSRLKILGYLKKHRSAAVVEIASETKCSYKATSKHLSILYRMDIVDREQVSYEMHYRLSDKLDPVTSAILKLI
ncbi:MAG: metalloregulator ArsR/SmtB family transcription factor [bacterium]|nr:metalloregulator ArsR/SmtB family transcription factor [bacterium]